MSSYDARISSLNNDTSDDNEKVRKPLLNHGSPNNDKTNSSTGSPLPFSNINEEEKFIGDHKKIDEQARNVSPVKDHYNVIYMVFLLFGIATLLPWNVFITANDYFVDYKLNTNESANSTYRTNFTFIVGSIGQFTNVIMNIFNILVTFGGNPKVRIPYTILLSAACIFFHIILAAIDSSAWPLTFFILCCVSVFIMYIATGILNSCVYCVAAIFPMEYVNAVILGNNLSGCFTAIMSVASKLATPNLRVAAIWYFISAFAALILGFLGYIVMHRMDFYKYWDKIKVESMKKQALDNNNAIQSVPYKKILKKIGFFLFCIWLNFFTTLSIFPVFNMGVKPNTPGFLGDWFQDICTFLTFNFLVTAGNLIPKLVKLPAKWLPTAVILRAIIVTLFFLFSNYKPDERTLPVLITNDYVYWAGCAISPLIFGYFTSLLMMYTPQLVEPEYAGTAAMLSALTLVIGVVSGLQFSVILDLLSKL